MAEGPQKAPERKKIAIDDSNLKTFYKELQFALDLAKRRNVISAQHGDDKANEWWDKALKQNNFSAEPWNDYAQRAKNLSLSFSQGLYGEFYDELAGKAGNFANKTGLSKIPIVKEALPKYPKPIIETLSRLSEETNPKMSSLAKGAGAAGPGAATMGVGTLPSMIRGSLTTLPSQMAAFSGSGAIENAIYNFIEALGKGKGGLVERFKTQNPGKAAAVGGVTGAIAGAASPVALAAGRNAAKFIAEATGNKRLLNRFADDAVFQSTKSSKPNIPELEGSLPLERGSLQTAGAFEAATRTATRTTKPIELLTERMKTLGRMGKAEQDKIWDGWKKDSHRVVASNASMRKFILNSQGSVKDAVRHIMKYDKETAKEIGKFWKDLQPIKTNIGTFRKPDKNATISKKGLEALRNQWIIMMHKSKSVNANKFGQLADQLVEVTPKVARERWKSVINESEKVFGNYAQRAETLGVGLTSAKSGARSAGTRAAEEVAGLHDPIEQAVYRGMYLPRTFAKSLYMNQAPTGNIGKNMANTLMDKLTNPANDLATMLSAGSDRAGRRAITLGGMTAGSAEAGEEGALDAYRSLTDMVGMGR